MNKRIKICPACQQGYLYHSKPKYLHDEIILCDECDAVWLKGMNIFYGEYEQDFYSYVPFRKSWWRNKQSNQGRTCPQRV